MTPFEKLSFNVLSELDVFISILQAENVITNKEVRLFIRDVVIPRLTTLRIMINLESEKKE